MNNIFTFKQNVDDNQRRSQRRSIVGGGKKGGGRNKVFGTCGD